MYDGEGVKDPNSCFDPGTPLDEDHFQLTIDDWIGGTQDLARNNLNFDPEPGPEGDGSYCSFEVEATYPPSGMLYINVHLDFGIKGKDVNANPVDAKKDRYDKATATSPWGSSDALENTPTGTGALALKDCRPFYFSHIDDGFGLNEADPVENLNRFKPIGSVFGLVSASASGVGEPSKAMKLIKKSTNATVKSGTTDSEGFYTLDYKHKGSATVYTVRATTPGKCGGVMNKDITMQPLYWYEVNFDTTTCTSTVESGKTVSSK